MRKLAVTGQPGSGKSEVCKILAEVGAEVVDSDQVAHQLLDPQTECGKEIIALLGEEILEKGKFSRERIAQKVFKDRTLLECLEKLLHPRILEEIEKKYHQSKAPLFVVEVPLLYESGWEGHFDGTILVTSTTREAFSERQWRFWPLEEKKKRAEIIIENNGSLEELKHKILKELNSHYGYTYGRRVSGSKTKKAKENQAPGEDGL